jgi:hypothetical protein
MAMTTRSYDLVIVGAGRGNMLPAPGLADTGERRRSSGAGMT